MNAGTPSPAEPVGPSRADAIPLFGPYAGDSQRDELTASHQLQLAMVRPGARVLDAGCGAGIMARALGEKGCVVTGFEYVRDRALAAEAHCARVIVGDLESGADRAQLRGPFDVILFGDVLEHLRRPGEVLAAARPLLAPGGRVVTSVPNIGVWRGRWTLLRGRFPYADSGLFDRTHLRFFTRASAQTMALEAGYRIVSEGFAGDQLPFPLVLRRFVPAKRTAKLRARLASAWPELFALQFVLELEPVPPSA